MYFNIFGLSGSTTTMATVPPLALLSRDYYGARNYIVINGLLDNIPELCINLPLISG